MDCVIVSSRIAAFLDGELAPSEVEQFSIHIERCDPCSQIVIRLEAQRFVPLNQQERASICSTAGFWGDMDVSLGAQMDEMVQVRTLVVGPWYSRKVGLPAPMLAAYAAAMLLVIAWGMQQRDRALSAEVSADHLGQQLEQERRIAAQPAPQQQGSSASGQYKVVNYTPQSGTF
jgi:anti-sigma factor RsiW